VSGQLDIKYIRGGVSADEIDFGDDPELLAVLNEVVSFVSRYVVMTAEQADTFALWVEHSHCVDAFELSPYLAISSAEKRSGKTTVMKVLGLLAARPWRVVTPSEAVVYRKIDRDHPTVLLDEYDTVFKDRDYEPLRALLNAGNEPGTTVPRCGGANRDQLIDFEIYCAKALAGIGKLPDTIADRTIEIRLKRKKAGEEVERFRRRIAREAAEPVRQLLVTIAERHADALAEARPEIPEALDDRAADEWEPLLSIADAAGGDWPARARRAALALSGGDARDDDSSGVDLLRDIRGIFDRREAERLTSSALCEDLHEIEESPWGEWYGKPLTTRGMAKILARYEIEPKPFRFGEQTLRGYERAWFEDQWSRLLPSPSATPQQTASEQGNPSEGIRNTNQDVADTKEGAKRHGSSDVADVADTSADNGQPKLSEQEKAALRDRIAREQLDRADAERAATDEQLRAGFENDTAEADYWAKRIEAHEGQG
jgi:hypothetical protein